MAIILLVLSVSSFLARNCKLGPALGFVNDLGWLGFINDLLMTVLNNENIQRTEDREWNGKNVSDFLSEFKLDR